MEPYYADDQVTLYLGDCREVTEWLVADVLVTDPPYGRRWRRGFKAKRGKHGVTTAHHGIAGDDDTTVRDSVLALWGDRPAVLFGDLMLAPPSGTKLVGVYRRPPDSGYNGALGGFRRDVEAWYLIGRWPSGLGGRSSMLATAARAQGSPSGLATRSGHPHAKPIDVMETLVGASPPGVIADPFAGSGSTLVAARNLGRSVVGVEIEEEYCERTALRMSQDVLPLGQGKG